MWAFREESGWGSGRGALGALSAVNSQSQSQSQSQIHYGQRIQICLSTIEVAWKLNGVENGCSSLYSVQSENGKAGFNGFVRDRRRRGKPSKLHIFRIKMKIDEKI